MDSDTLYEKIEVDVLGMSLTDLSDYDRASILGVGVQEFRNRYAAARDYSSALLELRRTTALGRGFQLRGQRDALPRSDAAACVDEELLTEIASLLARQRYLKGRYYGNSWISRGVVGAFHNMARKWDRIERIFAQASSGQDLVISRLPAHDGDESLMDTLGDLANYVLMTMQHLARTQHPRGESEGQPRSAEYIHWKGRIEKELDE